MSTRYANKKVVAEGEFERVNWLFASDLDTMAVSISEKSGLVKLDLGLGRRNPSLYANEILAILDKVVELRRYLTDHPQAKNTPPSAKALRASQALLDQVSQAKTDQINTMIKSMRDAGIAETVITETVSKLK